MDEGWVNFTEKKSPIWLVVGEPFATQTSCFTFVFQKLAAAAAELIAEIALHPSFPSRFKTMWYHDLLVEKFFCSWKLQSSFINFFSSHSISTTSSGTNFSTCLLLHAICVLFWHNCIHNLFFSFPKCLKIWESENSFHSSWYWKSKAMTDRQRDERAKWKENSVGFFN